MIEKTLKELIETQHYCVIETCGYPFEGFVTDFEDDMIEMYVFSDKITADDDNSELENTDDKMIERVVFPISHIEYIFPNYYLKLKPATLEAKTFLAQEVIKSARVALKPKKATKTVKSKKDPGSNNKKQQSAK